MKIAFDAKRAFYNNTGLGNYSRNTIRQLTTFYPEHEYSLFTPKNSNAIAFPISSNSRIVLPDSMTGKLFKSYWRSYLCGFQAVKSGIELFHGLSNEIPFGLAGSKTKTITTIHDLIFLRYPELYKKIDRKIYDRKFRYAAKHSDLVIAVSKQTQQDIIEEYKVPESRVTVVYQGCNQVFFNKAEESALQELKKRYKLPADFILYVGTIEARKNLLGLLKAIRASGLEIPVVAIGRKTEYYKEVANYVEEHSMTARVLFFDNLPNQDLQYFYQAAKLFVYPSIFEGFGIPILESLASGTPVVTSKGSCFPEAGGEGALYSDPQDPEETGHCIRSILENNELRKELSEKGRLHAQGFTDETVARNLMGAYQKIL